MLTADRVPVAHASDSLQNDRFMHVMLIFNVRRSLETTRLRA